MAYLLWFLAGAVAIIGIAVWIADWFDDEDLFE